MQTYNKILIGILVPIGLVLIYLIYRVLAGRYLNLLYEPGDTEAARSKAILDEGGRPPSTDFHSNGLDSAARKGWKKIFWGGSRGNNGRQAAARDNDTDSTRGILGSGALNPSTRSLITGYGDGEEYEMGSILDVPTPPSFLRPHLASSLGTQVRCSPYLFFVLANVVKVPAAAKLAKRSPQSLRSFTPRSRAGSDPFLDSSSSVYSFDPRPARIRALSGGEGSSKLPLPRLPRPVARGSPLRTTVRSESVGGPVSTIYIALSSLC